ncbi:ACP S-malonyltransferase [Anoxybacterium hadale]|uniref:ACP S-malonyltransferase n=1 Tax=Anoxybacterium hadale TaxID=3408580 RepID=A0ACD1AE00_9FIRM|nr:ACP S-malonyltransferase [Clostridiales bacterium]
MKIGLLFAGQGAQYSGMGKSLYENSKEAKKVFDLAGDEIKEWCFEGAKEILRQTNITQPCVYTVSIAAYEAFLEGLSNLEEELLDQLEMQGMAGFSLGEYAALTAGGSIADFETGLEIVKNRGAWMNDAGRNAEGENLGGMIAAFGERARILNCVEASREEGVLEGVNFNSPVQTVVAGDKDALERFKIKSKEMGQIKAVPLSVGSAFHSPMMEPAKPKLRELLAVSKLKHPTTKIYSNVTGGDIMEGCQGSESEWLADIMAKQVTSPVYWQETIENMEGEGIHTFIEIGPGNTLCGLVKKICPGATTMNIEDYETLSDTINKLKEMIAAE